MSPRRSVSGPTGPVPDTLTVERVGLGYVGTLMPAGVVMGVDRIVQSRGELLGELTVERAMEGHVFIGRFNLSSVSARRQTAQYLGGRTNNVDWEGALEHLCLEVLQRERAGQPFDEVGALPPLAALDWVLDPLLVRGEPTILFGAGDAGKSLLAAFAAFSVSTGQQALTGFRPAGRANVLVVDWEDQRQQWNDRVAAIAKWAGVDPPRIGYRRGMGVPLTDQVHDLAQHVAQQSVGLLIVDSVGLAMPSNAEGADANESTRRLFAALRQLDVTTLLIDHIGKVDYGGEALAKAPYGSVYKQWMARSVWQLRLGSTTPDGTLHLGLWHTKFNAGPKHAPIGLGVRFGPGEISFDREDLADDESLVTALTPRDRILAALRAGGRTVAQLSESTGIAPNQLRTYLQRYEAQRLVGIVAGSGREKVWGSLETSRDDAPPAPSATPSATLLHNAGDDREDDRWG